MIKLVDISSNVGLYVLHTRVMRNVELCTDYHLVVFFLR